MFAQKPYGKLGYGVHGFGNSFDFLDPHRKTVFTVIDDEQTDLYKLRAKPASRLETKSWLYLSVADTSSTVNPILLWHERFAHSGVGAVVKTAGLVDGMNSDLSKFEIPNTICGSCAAGKQTYRHSAFEPAGEWSKNLLQLVHVDLAESNVRDIFGCKYWFSIIDDYSRMSWVILLKHKDEAFEALREWITWAKIKKTCKSKEYSLIKVVKSLIQSQ